MCTEEDYCFHSGLNSKHPLRKVQSYWLGFEDAQRAIEEQRGFHAPVCFSLFDTQTIQYE